MLNNGEDRRRVAALALSEDGGRDLTTDVTVTTPIQARGIVEFKTSGVLAGTGYADAVALACGCQPSWTHHDGDAIVTGQTAGHISGLLRDMLRAERPLLNLLQRATGIATLTRQFVQEVQGTACRVLHTRKTVPGLRLFDLAAVLAGGGALHRTDLAAVVMVKDNHWKALDHQGRSLAASVQEARARGAARVYIEVETTRQLDLACEAGADRLLIDNQSADTVRQWVGRARSQRPAIEIEATGGITLGNARAYAGAGADFISIGALTHSVLAADISLEITF
jgi:nicotinate-nucleotide pyrophosphorylase (carboxylating)